MITFNSRDSLRDIPTRSAFLDEGLVRQTDIDIKNGSVLFMPNSVKEYHDYGKYKILLIGILPDGRKAGVIIDNCLPYFEIRRPDGQQNNTSEEAFKQLAERILSDYKGVKIEKLLCRGFDKYEQPTLYLRLYFRSSYNRKKAIAYCMSNGLQTTTDDMNHYVRVVCRSNNFSLCSWNRITSYISFAKDKNCKLPKVFRVRCEDLEKVETCNTQQHVRDKTIVEAWDIEAYSDSGELPDPERKGDVVFMIGKTYHWKDNPKPFLSICLVSRPCTPRNDKLTIVCKNEKDLILASFMLDSMLMPDFIVGFNDGSFDWSFVITKAKQYNILCKIKEELSLFNDPQSTADSIFRWDCMARKIKLDSGMNALSRTLAVPGAVHIDVRTMLRKIHPTESKSSLNFYLKKYNIAGKEDMPISELFRIYRDSINGIDVVDRMADVAHYCVIDAQRCQELMCCANIIGDNREVSDISHTSMFDAVYYAGSVKVRNLVISEGIKRGILFSTKSKEDIPDGKYPGAYVFPPVKGLIAPKLTVRERKAVVPTWKHVTDDELCIMENTVANSGSPLSGTPLSGSACKLFDQFINEEIKYPISGLDFSSLYPSIIMTYNLSPEYMLFDRKDIKDHDVHAIEFLFNGVVQKAWSIRHGTVDGEQLLPNKTVNQFGLYPYILKNLFDKRVLLKDDLKKYAKIKEDMENKQDVKSEAYVDVCFQYNYINSKQKALKVFMNTFYGETGNKTSPFFVVAIAGGITSAGQRNIKMISDLVVRHGCKMYYGDTDSCYISCPPQHFTEHDRLYYSGQINKIQYCTCLVKTTFEQINTIKDLANNYLIQDNSTNFLKMAYEEVLFPCMFLLKKMYTGIEHKHQINFEPNNHNLFIKGLALKKRDVSGAVTKICIETLMEILNIHNTNTVRGVIRSKIKSIYEREWDISEFKKTAVYKPHKNNITVKTFYDIMVVRNDVDCPPPVPNERFEYIVVKKYPFKYDRCGRKTVLKVGEKWEYYEYAIKHNLDIDLNYYVLSGVAGQFAQLIAYRSSLPEAKKYIKSIFDSIVPPVECKGPLLKQQYRLATKNIIPVIAKCPQNKCLYLHMKESLTPLDAPDASDAPDTPDASGVPGYAYDIISELRKQYGVKFIYDALNIYKNMAFRQEAHIRMMDQKLQKLSTTDFDMNDMQNLYWDLKTAINIKHQTDAVVEHMNFYLSKRKEKTPVPPGVDIKQDVDQALKLMITKVND